jgi:hypothetical protein
MSWVQKLLNKILCQLLRSRRYYYLQLLRICMEILNKNKRTPWTESASELYRPSDRHLSAKLVLTFEDRGSHVVSVTDPYGRILGFLDRSPYFFFQVAPQLYSRGWVDTVPDPLLFRKSGIAGNLTRTSGSVDHRGGLVEVEVNLRRQSVSLSWYQAPS